MKFKHRIQLALPPELEIKYNPDANTTSLGVFLQDKQLECREKNGDYYDYVYLKTGQSIEEWMAHTIDIAKSAYEKLMMRNQNDPLRELDFQRVELVTDLDRKRLSAQSPRWARVSESLANELGSVGADQVIQQLHAMGLEFENALGTELSLDVVSLLKKPGVSVIVKKKNPDGTLSPYQPMPGFNDSLISQQDVPKFSIFRKPLSWIPLRKTESPAVFFQRVLGHIRHLKKQEEERTLYQEFLKGWKALEMNHVQVYADDFLHAFGWETLKPTLTSINDYIGFIHQLDPKVHLTYTGKASSEEISIAYQDDKGSVCSILGEIHPVGDSRFVVQRTKKQTPDMFLKAVYEEVKVLLAERQNTDNLLHTYSPEDAFSF
jgi:hypothetical protein